MSASTLIQEAMQDLMDSDLGVDALYLPTGGLPTEVRIIKRVPEDHGGSILRTGLNVEGIAVEVLVSQIGQAGKGDKLTIDYSDDLLEWEDPEFWRGQTVATVRKAVKDRQGLFWILDLDKDLS